jgi:hypothetical protein
MIASSNDRVSFSSLSSLWAVHRQPGVESGHVLLELPRAVSPPGVADPRSKTIDSQVSFAGDSSLATSHVAPSLRSRDAAATWTSIAPVSVHEQGIEVRGDRQCVSATSEKRKKAFADNPHFSGLSTCILSLSFWIDGG